MLSRTSGEVFEEMEFLKGGGDCGGRVLVTTTTKGENTTTISTITITSRRGRRKRVDEFPIAAFLCAFLFGFLDAVGGEEGELAAGNNGDGAIHSRLVKVFALTELSGGEDVFAVVGAAFDFVVAAFGVDAATTHEHLVETPVSRFRCVVKDDEGIAFLYIL